MSINNTLNWACQICEKLCIADPVEWLNNVDGKTFDLWVAYFTRQDSISNGRK